MLYLLTELNECDSLPCLNGGTCFNAINAYICTCVAGFTDLECSSGNVSLLLIEQVIISHSTFSTVVQHMGHVRTNNRFMLKVGPMYLLFFPLC